MKWQKWEDIVYEKGMNEKVDNLNEKETIESTKVSKSVKEASPTNGSIERRLRKN